MVNATPATFATDARQTLEELRAAISQVIESLNQRGDAIRRTQLGSILGLDRKLGWKISRVVDAQDPFEAAQHIPGKSGWDSFLRAAANKGAPHEFVARLQHAIAEFEDLMRVHAGDRATLEMMLASCGSRGRENVDLMHRKAAFRANSYIWGVQAHTHLKADFLHPGSMPGMLDIATLHGFIGLRRIRANIPWIIGRGRCVDNDGQARVEFAREPLDPGAAPGEAPLLRDFCSKPLPVVRRTRSTHGFMDDEIVAGPVGKTADITCLTGEVFRNCASCRRDEHNQVADFISRQRTPCEVLILDHIVHEDIFGRVDPEFVVYSDLLEAAPYPGDGRDIQTLPACETVTYLGKGASALHTPDVPRYAEMARHLFSRLGWDSARFDVYRVCLAFPPIPASAVIHYELPEPSPPATPPASAESRQ